MMQSIGMRKVYLHETCSTCRNASQWLNHAGIEYKAVSIRQTPPTKTELKRALKHLGGNLRKLFNTSGMDYRALGLKDKLPLMSEQEAIDLLHGNGMLVKRPFLIDDQGVLTGFKPADWEAHFG